VNLPPSSQLARLPVAQAGETRKVVFISNYALQPPSGAATASARSRRLALAPPSAERGR